MGVTESSNNFGFRVYKLYKESPLEKAGIKELEDFIIPPEGVNDLNFREYLSKFINKKIDLVIYNFTSRSFHKVSVIPNLNWGNGPCSTKGCLGGLVSYEKFSTAHLNLLRILKVNENSLAHKIGLTPLNDYILAVKPQNDNFISLNSNSKNNDPLSLFSILLKANLNKHVILYIFNSETGGRTIELYVDPKEKLGCDVGFSKGNEFPQKQNLIFMPFLDNQSINSLQKNETVFNFSQSLAESLNILSDKESDNPHESYDPVNKRKIKSSENTGKLILDADSKSKISDISPIFKSLNTSHNLHTKTISSLSSNSNE
jgi:hypothetical protein